MLRPAVVAQDRGQGDRPVTPWVIAAVAGAGGMWLIPGPVWRTYRVVGPPARTPRSREPRWLGKPKGGDEPFAAAASYELFAVCLRSGLPVGTAARVVADSAPPAWAEPSPRPPTSSRWARTRCVRGPFPTTPIRPPRLWLPWRGVRRVPDRHRYVASGSWPTVSVPKRKTARPRQPSAPVSPSAVRWVCVFCRPLSAWASCRLSSDWPGRCSAGDCCEDLPRNHRGTKKGEKP